MENWGNIRSLIEYSRGGILSKKILEDGSLDLTLFCMAKDTKISEHTSTKKGFIYVIEGDGEFDLSGEKILMKPSIIINLEKNAVHSLKAFENTSFILSLFQLL